MAAGKASAIANNDYVHVAWDFGTKLAGCGGFAVYRIARGEAGAGTPVASFGRDAQGNRTTVTCEDQPIRKYNWRDVYAKRGGSFRYRVVPMAGPHQPLAGAPVAETEEVTLSPLEGSAQVFFNRGILATQHVSDALWNPAKQKPDFAKIESLIGDTQSALRKSLSGQLYEALSKLLDRAATDGGSCWASLYELTDPALIDKLCECRDLHLIVSNDNKVEEVDGQAHTIYDGLNQPGVKKIATEGPGRQVEVLRRYMPTGQIGHNKFLVYVDGNGKARAVLTGSTNWTPSGLCTQSNNAILIDSADLAKQYLEYWRQLKDDALRAGIPEQPAPMKKIQDDILRGQCAVPRQVLPLNAGSTVKFWCSPNAASLIKSGAKTKPATPADLAEVYDIMRAAKQSVLFLAFMPGKAGSSGSHHFLEELAAIAKARPALFVRGAVSDPALTKEFDLASLASGVHEDVMISSPQGIFKEFAAWRPEIYKYGHAIIHDKTIVVDPFGKDCVVITGSHNLGYRASSNNDENMLIIRGDQGISQAYAAHVMDIFEHYRSRWIAASHKEGDYDPQSDAGWQDRYFDPSRPAFGERLFWTSGGAPLPALAPALNQAKLAATLEAKKQAAAALAARKVPAKKAAPKKVAAKKVPTKKVAGKKVATKKLAAGKVVAPKAAATKQPTRRTPPRKAAVRPPSAKQAGTKRR